MGKKGLLAVLAAGLLLTMTPVSPAVNTAAAEETTAVPGKTFYVATNGSDTNSGTEQEPFQTLEKARDAIRDLKSGQGLPDGGVAVYLREGRYERPLSFDLKEQDSGEADKPIVYASYPNEEVVLSGSHKLNKSDFGAVSDPAILNRIISTEARTQVQVADLQALGLTDYGVQSRHGYYLANDLSQVPPMELYVNGQGMTLARWPNEGTVQMDTIVDAGPTRKEKDQLAVRGGTFSYTYDRPQYWTQASDIWLDGIFGHSWEWSYNKIQSIDTQAKTITLRYGEMSGLLMNGTYPDFHFAQNLLEEIDMPGEYYIDRQAGKLYFLPNAEFNQSAPDIEVTMLKTPMINALNASYIDFSGLVLENGRDSAAVLMGGDHMRILSSEIRNFSNSGVLVNTQSRFYYDTFTGGPGHDNAIANTHIHHIGGTAVTLVGGDPATLEPGNNVVQNSHIHDFAYYHKAYNPGVMMAGVGNKMIGNELHDAPHPGVLVFGNDHLIEYNEIYDVCKNFSDLGAIYMNAGETPQQRGTVIRRNYFHNIGEKKGGVQGIYPDNFTMGLKIEENVFYKMGNSAILNNGGSHIQTKNNIFVDSKVPYEYSEQFLGDKPEGQIAKNYMPKWQALFAANNNFVGTPYLAKYPELADFFTENRYYPDTNTMKGNLIYNPTVARSSLVNANGAKDTLNLVQYANNWIASQDPGFVDLAGGDLSLAPNAAVFAQIPNFPDIPFDQMGTDGQVGTGLDPAVRPVAQVVAYDAALTLGRWKTAKLRATVLPWNADDPKLTYVSANPEIASVDDTGVVTGGRTIGQTTITISSAANPQLTAAVPVTVENSDGIIHYTDFETGRNGWAKDSYRPVDIIDGNHWYRVKNGVTAMSPINFTDYELTFKLKTPEVLADAMTLYVFDKQSGSTSTRIGYKARADGTSSWLLYDTAWGVKKEEKLPTHDLQPDTEYTVKVRVKGGDVTVYVDGAFRLKGTDPLHNPQGTVGFYVSGATHLWFDDIRFKALESDNALAGIVPASRSARVSPGEQQTLNVTFDPVDTPDTSVTWTSADPAIATVDASGVITGVAEGQTTVTVASTTDPQIRAEIAVTVSNIMHETNFESGGNGWPVDPNRSIAADPDGNHRYKILSGATALLNREFTDYELAFKLKTPTELPAGGGTLYIFDRQDASGSIRIGYKAKADGTSAWILYNTAWQPILQNALPNLDLQANTEYDVKVTVIGGSINVDVNGVNKLTGTAPGYRPSGKVGFYVSGFSQLLFDNIVFSVPTGGTAGTAGRITQENEADFDLEIPSDVPSDLPDGISEEAPAAGEGSETPIVPGEEVAPTDPQDPTDVPVQDGTPAVPDVPADAQG